MENQIIISHYGSGIAVGLQGSEDFVEKQTNRFFNYGGITKQGEFHSVTENFGFFLSSVERMISAIATQYFVSFQMDGTSKQFKGRPDLMEKATKEKASEEFNSYLKENFMTRYERQALSILGLAENGRAESWEEDFKMSK